MPGMRDDDFNEVEKFRIKPDKPVKALRQYTGAAKVAFGSEYEAWEVADSIRQRVSRIASWAVPEVLVSDNILDIPKATYVARSANADDLQQLILSAEDDAQASRLSKVAIKTLGSTKLGEGR